MINLKRLRFSLLKHIDSEEIDAGKYPVKGRLSSIDKRITIKRKKKIVIEETTNGKGKAKRKDIIKIEIIE